MPSVPITSRGTVERQAVGPGQLRYQAPRNLVGPAVQDFGRALGGVAEGIDEIEAAKDQAYAVDSDNQGAVKASEIANEFKSLKGDMPDRQLPGALKQFDDMQAQLLGEARSERAKSILKRTLSVRRANLQSSLNTHATSEMLSFQDSALGAGRDQARDDAIGAAGTEQFGVAIGTGLVRIAERGKLLGLPKEAIEVENSKFLDEVHGGVLDTMFAVPDPDVDAIGNYLNTHGGQMTPKLENQVLARLQNPLQQRVARGDVANAMGFVKPVPGEAPTPTAALAAKPIAVEMLREFEGFREGTYWDVDHHRVGYGSDTITTASGQVRTVKQGDRVNRDDADRDLARRTDRLEKTAAGKAGSGWNVLPAGARAAVVSVAYNYGEGHDRLKPLWAAAAKGDAGAVAEVIEGFAGDNNGINRDRRLREAATARNGGGYESTPREWDRAQVYDTLEATAARETWTPERLERARAEADKVIARDEGLLKERRDDADEAASSIVAAKGDGFRVHMIPPDVWNTLTEVQKREFKDIEKELLKPKEPVANGARQTELALMRIYEPEAFASHDLRKDVGKMTRAELDTLLQQQATLRVEATKPAGATFSPRSGITSAISWGNTYGGVPLGDKDKIKVYNYMEAFIAERAKVGKVTEKDYTEAFQSAVRENGEGDRFYEVLTDIPDSFREGFNRNWRGNRPPKESEIVAGYRDWLRRR